MVWIELKLEILDFGLIEKKNLKCKELRACFMISNVWFQNVMIFKVKWFQVFWFQKIYNFESIMIFEGEYMFEMEMN